MSGDNFDSISGDATQYESSSNQQASSSLHFSAQDAEDTQFVCWVCYGTELDSPNAEWVSPCQCRGTGKWVHHVCLMRWIDEKQRGQPHAKVSCPQCNTEYVIYFPPLGFFCEGLQLLDRFIFKSSPALATGVVLTSLYWSATTYGAISLMQVVGHKEGLDLMEKTDPLFLLIGLPTIPVVMVCGKMVPWDEYLLKLWRRNAHKIPILNYLFSLEDPSRYRSSLVPIDSTPAREIKFTRVFCGAMLFPTIAALVGKLAFRNVKGNFRRSILGGVTFVMVKGILKIYLQQRIYSLSSHRKVAPYSPQLSPDTEESSPSWDR